MIYKKSQVYLFPSDDKFIFASKDLLQIKNLNLKRELSALAWFGIKICVDLFYRIQNYPQSRNQYRRGCTFWTEQKQERFWTVIIIRIKPLSYQKLSKIDTKTSESIHMNFLTQTNIQKKNWIFFCYTLPQFSRDLGPLIWHCTGVRLCGKLGESSCRRAPCRKCNITFYKTKHVLTCFRFEVAVLFNIFKQIKKYKLIFWMKARFYFTGVGNLVGTLATHNHRHLHHSIGKFV